MTSGLGRREVATWLTLALLLVSSACGSERPEDPTTTATTATGAAEAYLRHCANCHGAGGQGGSGPALAGISDRMSRARMASIASEGRPPGMPAFGATLGDSEIEAIVSYIRSELG